MNIIDKIFTKENELSGPQIFAICRKWQLKQQNLKYEQFQDHLFNCNLNFSKIDNYSLCICQEEEIQLNSLLYNFNSEFNTQPLKPKIIQQNSLEQVLKVDKRNQAHYVSKALWEFLEEQIKGGSCIPLYTMSKYESNVARTKFENLKFMKNYEIENLIPNLVVPVDMTQIEFLIQKEDDSLIYLTKVAPLSLQQNNQQQQLLHLISTIQIFYKFISNKNSTFICELQKKSLWFLKSSMTISNRGMKFNENLNEVQMREDLQSLKTCSTVSNTESRISSLSNMKNIKHQHIIFITLYLMIIMLRQTTLRKEWVESAKYVLDIQDLYLLTINSSCLKSQDLFQVATGMCFSLQNKVRFRKDIKREVYLILSHLTNQYLQKGFQRYL